MRSSIILVGLVAVSLALGVACSSATPDVVVDAGFDGSVLVDAAVEDTAVDDTATPDVVAVDVTEAGKVVPPGLIDPISYKSFSDSPFKGVSFPAYFHFEDWEDGALSTPGVASSSTTVSGSFGASLIDSVDGDDGVIDGKCSKDGGICNANFANGTVEYTFDAAGLGGNLPTHVGIVWTDGSPGCDAIFEAYDSSNVLIGTKTAAAVGDSGNVGTVDEDRFFGVVHAAGVKRIVVKSSAGGVEVDHLQYGRI